MNERQSIEFDFAALRKSDEAVLRSYSQLEAAWTKALDELVDTLALAIAISSDIELLARLRISYGVECLAIRMPGSEIWLEVGSEPRTKIHRSLPQSMAGFTFETLEREVAGFRSILISAAKRTGARKSASKILEPLLSPSRYPVQAEIEALLPWCPIIERRLYSMATGFSMILDSLRPLILADQIIPRRELKQWRRLYWSHANLSGRLTLLACSADAQPWLIDMARSFVWQNWTPSSPLVRERSIWLCAIGARAAAAFGAATIEFYCARLEETKIPMQAFDAILGLTSIAVADDAVRSTTAAYLRSPQVASQVENVDVVKRTVAAALSLLEDSRPTAERAAKRLGWTGSAVRGFATAAALAGDGTQFWDVGDIPALSVIPLALAAEPAQFFPLIAPDRFDLHLGLKDIEITELVLNSWNATKPRAEYGRLH